MTRILGALQIMAIMLQLQPMPPRRDRLYHTILAVLQALGWWAQREYNPDGTSAAVAYLPVKK